LIAMAFSANFAVGRSEFERLLAIRRPIMMPITSNSTTRATDVLLPHPQYAYQGWISILNPASGPARRSSRCSTMPITWPLGGHARRRAR
jgi:hypothetical protein